MTTCPTELRRAHAWIVGGDTGLSSKHIWAVMMGVEPVDPYYPLDPDDFGRCLRLLDAVPEWKPRIGEMAAQGVEWAALAARWAEVEALFLAEGGSLDPRPGTRMLKTYDLMKQIEAGAAKGGRRS